MDMANWGHTLLGDPIIGFIGGMQRNRLQPLNDRIHAGTLVTARVFNTSEQTLGTVGTALLFCEVGRSPRCWLKRTFSGSRRSGFVERRVMTNT